MALSPGVVPDYQLSMPHYWSPLHSSNRKDIDDMQGFTSYLHNPSRAIIGAPQGDEERNRHALMKKHPTDTQFLIEAQLYQLDQQKRQASKVERKRLHKMKAARNKHHAEVVDSYTNAPRLFNREGKEVALGLETRRWLQTQHPDALKKWDTLLAQAHVAAQVKLMYNPDDEFFSALEELEKRQRARDESKEACEKAKAAERHEKKVRQLEADTRHQRNVEALQEEEHQRNDAILATAAKNQAETEKRREEQKVAKTTAHRAASTAKQDVARARVAQNELENFLESERSKADMDAKSAAHKQRLEAKNNESRKTGNARVEKHKKTMQALKKGERQRVQELQRRQEARTEQAETALSEATSASAWRARFEEYNAIASPPAGGGGIHTSLSISMRAGNTGALSKSTVDPKKQQDEVFQRRQAILEQRVASGTEFSEAKNSKIKATRNNKARQMDNLSAKIREEMEAEKARLQKVQTDDEVYYGTVHGEGKVHRKPRLPSSPTKKKIAGEPPTHDVADPFAKLQQLQQTEDGSGQYKRTSRIGSGEAQFGSVQYRMSMASFASGAASPNKTPPPTGKNPKQPASSPRRGTAAGTRSDKPDPSSLLKYEQLDELYEKRVSELSAKEAERERAAERRNEYLTGLAHTARERRGNLVAEEQRQMQQRRIPHSSPPPPKSRTETGSSPRQSTSARRHQQPAKGREGNVSDGDDGEMQEQAPAAPVTMEPQPPLKEQPSSSQKRVTLADSQQAPQQPDQTATSPNTPAQEPKHHKQRLLSTQLPPSFNVKSSNKIPIANPDERQEKFFTRRRHQHETAAEEKKLVEAEQLEREVRTAERREELLSEKARSMKERHDADAHVHTKSAAQRQETKMEAKQLSLNQAKQHLADVNARKQQKSTAATQQLHQRNTDKAQYFAENRRKQEMAAEVAREAHAAKHEEAVKSRFSLLQRQPSVL